MAKKPIILVGAKGFWSMKDIVGEAVFKGKFELLYDEELYISEARCPYVAAIVVADQPLGPELMDRYPNLKTIARTGTGYDNVDIAAARARKIIVTRVAKLNAESVSDFALGLIFALSRGIVQVHENMIRSRWERKAGMLLHEMTIGIIGFGAIGQSLAQKLRVLGRQQILFWNRSLYPAVQEAAAGCGAKFVTLHQVMENSDIVVVAVALTDDTRHLINKELLYRMKPTAFLVNVCRGAVVDEEALADCVAEGRIAGMALDVYSVEPPDGSPFDLPHVQKLILCANEGKNVILTPHNAWMTQNSIRRVSVKVAQNVVSVLEGRTEEAEVV